MNYKKKVVLIYSGGLDSTVLMYELLNQNYKVQLISFDYGQRHNKEIRCAVELVKTTLLAKTSVLKYKFYDSLSHAIVSLPSFPRFLSGSSQTSKNISVPEGHYEGENMKQTFVPNRNMIMLSIAYGYATSIDADAIAFGAHKNDYAIYPDCRPEFVDAFAQSAHLGNYKQLDVLAPFIHNTKAEIIKLGAYLQVPFEKTWSCYNGRDKACGRCGTCVERLESFHKAGMTDPLEYEDREFWKGAINVHT